MSKATVNNLRSTTSKSQAYGIPPNVFEETPARALCELCTKVTNDPQFLEACGHRYCHLCLQMYVYVVDNDVDVSDDTKFQAALQAVLAGFEPNEKAIHVCCATDCGESFDWTSVNPDRALQKRLDRSNCRCANSGCDFRGLCSAYIEHSKVCKYADVECEFCSQPFTRREIGAHKETCEHRPESKSTCRYCRKQFPSKLIQQHVDSDCDEKPATCLFCMQEMQRWQLPKHEVDCKLMDGDCPLGCQVEPGTPAKEHYERNEVVHMQRIQKNLTVLQSGSNSDAGSVLSDFKIGQVMSTFYRLQKLHQSTRSDLSRNNASPSSQVDVTQLVKLVPIEKAVTLQRFTHAEEQLTMLKHELDVTDRKINENGRLAFENRSQLDALKTNLETFAEKLQRDNVSIHLLERKTAHLNDLTQDGIFTWRIDKLRQKCETAKTSADKSIYSPTFYTLPNGYMLRLRFFPNGYGATEGVYMALYVILCRGEFDAINKWPFTRNVEVACLDQRVNLQAERGADKVPKHKHAVFSLKPDVENQLQAFSRPVSSMNPGFGVAEFLPINQGKIFKPADDEPAYVKDDIIFLRVIVDPFDS